jgi:hypothetical protein
MVSKANIVAVSFIGGGNQNTWIKPPTFRKSLTDFITECCIEYTCPLAGFEQWRSALNT